MRHPDPTRSLAPHPATWRLGVATAPKPPPRRPAADPVIPQVIAGRSDPGLGVLLRLCSDGIAVFDRDGRVLFANQTAASALGFPGINELKTVTPEHFEKWFHVEADGSSSPLAGFPGQAIFTGRPEAEEVLRFRDPAGGWDRWVSVRARPFAEDKARPVAVVALLRDISEERRRESSARFLEDASGRLLRSVGSERVFEHAAVSAVPRLGDECVLAALGADGEYVPVASYMPGVADAGAALDLVRGFAPLYAQLEAGGRGLLIAPSGGDRSGSVVLAPVSHGREMLAVLLLAMAPDTARAHHPSDLALAEQFGTRIGHAIAFGHKLETAERRRRASEEGEATARRMVVASQQYLGALAEELGKEIAPLQAAAELLHPVAADGDRCLVEIVQRRAHQLRALVESLFRAS